MKLKKKLAVSLVLCGLLISACYAKDNSKILTVDEPRMVNGSIEFSMTPNTDIKDINILTALYRDNKLCDVKINALSGTFKTEDSNNYTLKIFTWEKGSMKHFGECYTYPNIIEKGKLKRELNNTLQGENGTIHYTTYFPENYDETKSYPMLVTLPGWSSLFNTIEHTPLTDNPYADKNAEAWSDILGDMIVVSPSLTDWGNRSAYQTIELVDYFTENYSVDKTKIYAAGHSAGGETLSRVIDLRPELFAAYLHSASQWDGGYDNAAKNKVPIYICMAQNDEYYGARTATTAYDNLKSAYLKNGISESELGDYLVLDLKDNSYFKDNFTGSYHGGGQLFAYDSDIIHWLISRK